MIISNGVKNNMNDVKMIIMLLKTGSQAGFYRILGLLFSVVGVLIELTGGYDDRMLGVFFIIVSGLYMGQVVTSNALAKSVQASPYGKKIQTVYASAVYFIFILIGFAVVTGCELLRTVIKTGAADDSASVFSPGAMIVIASIIGVFFSIMVVLSLKSYIVGVIIVALGFVAYSVINLYFDNALLRLFEGLDIPAAVLTGLAVIFVGVAIIYSVSCLMYKMEFSKSAARNIVLKNGN